MRSKPARIHCSCHAKRMCQIKCCHHREKSTTTSRIHCTCHENHEKAWPLTTSCRQNDAPVTQNTISCHLPQTFFASCPTEVPYTPRHTRGRRRTLTTKRQPFATNSGNGQGLEANGPALSQCQHPSKRQGSKECHRSLGVVSSSVNQSWLCKHTVHAGRCCGEKHKILDKSAKIINSKSSQAIHVPSAINDSYSLHCIIHVTCWLYLERLYNVKAHLVLVVVHIV